jgi:hypothetical protein
MYPSLTEIELFQRALQYGPRLLHLGFVIPFQGATRAKIL